MTRLAAALLSAVMVLDLLTVALAITIQQAYPANALGRGTSPPKVVLIVGPSGRLTDAWRREAAAAAAIARRFTNDVTEIHSPDATWPVVRRALQGASLVVYLGHGNGWPSPYRDELYPPTQNGLGLNPVAGVDDVAHQYFGERYLARKVRLAPGAIVLLHHLCYASGDGEPGMADPSRAVAQQRVDNYAAGWLEAGARAVVAEGHLGPAYYVRRLLGTSTNVLRAWRRSPHFNDHVSAFDSVRSPGFTAYLDPERTSSRYFRSLVLDVGQADQGFVHLPVRSEPEAAVGSLLERGVKPGIPRLGDVPIAGERVAITIPLELRKRADVPKAMMVGTRWVPILPIVTQPDPGRQHASGDGVDPAAVRPSGDPGVVPPRSGEGVSNLMAAHPARQRGRGRSSATAADPADEAKPASPATVESAGTPSPSPDRTPGATDAPEAATSSPVPTEEGAIAFETDVVPENMTSLVTPADATRKARGLVSQTTVPERPGVYRLVVTIHDREGVAFDAATQASIPALLVNVSGMLWARYDAVSEVWTDSGARMMIPVALRNSGSLPWATPLTAHRVEGDLVDVPRPYLTARWIALGADRSPSARVASVEPPGDVALPTMVPGATSRVEVEFLSPPPGDYLLVLDVVSPAMGSLAARGVPPWPLIVHVRASSVTPTASPSADALPTPKVTRPPPVEGPPMADDQGPLGQPSPAQ